MSEFTLQERLPSGQQVSYRTVTAIVVGATLYALDGSLRFAAWSATGVLAITLAGDVAEAAVGDYADNVVLGLAVLGFTVAFLRSWVPGLLVGVLVGSWFVFDGVQHLRHDQTRETVIGSDHDGGHLTGTVRALAGRLLQSFRL